MKNNDSSKINENFNPQNQEAMEESLKAQISEVYQKQVHIVNGMMQPEFVDCSFAEKTLTLSFPVLEWEKNRVGYMHGGIVGAAFDIAMGFLTRFLIGESFAPTISLETVFIRPIPIGDTLVIHVKTNMSGRKLTHLYAEAFLKSSGKLVATATSSYLNENTSRAQAQEE